MKHPLDKALRELAVTLRKRGYPEHEVEAILVKVADDVAAGRGPLLDGYLNVGAVEELYPEVARYRSVPPLWVIVVLVAGALGGAWWGELLRWGSPGDNPGPLRWAVRLCTLVWPSTVLWLYYRRSSSLPTPVRQAMERVRTYPLPTS